MNRVERRTTGRLKGTAVRAGRLVAQTAPRTAVRETIPAGTSRAQQSSTTTEARRRATREHLTRARAALDRLGAVRF